MKTAICFLTRTPNQTLIEFSELIISQTNMPVFIMIDNNNFIILNNDNSKIKYLQINNHECINAGFSYSLKYECCSWDKALYYFTKINTEYDHVWFIEDDVFIPSVSALINLEQKYPLADLLSVANRECKMSLHRYNRRDKLNQPWFESMVCATRLSRKLFQKINEFVDKTKVVIFHEFFFNTLAMHNNLLIETPQELSTILYRRDWTFDDIKQKKFNLFHPIKNFELHAVYRTKLLSETG
jgi:hypothetical protein